MGFFSSSDKITHHEFRKSLFRLKDKGFTDSQIESVRSAFRGDLDEEGPGSGVSKDELKKGIEWLKEHPNHHHLEPHHIEKISEVLRHYL